MIAGIFDRGWVHPWRRPAEERRSVSLSAPVMPLPEEPVVRWCVPCDVKWRGDPECWNCGSGS